MVKTRPCMSGSTRVCKRAIKGALISAFITPVTNSATQAIQKAEAGVRPTIKVLKPKPIAPQDDMVEDHTDDLYFKSGRTKKSRKRVVDPNQMDLFGDVKAD